MMTIIVTYFLNIVCLKIFKTVASLDPSFTDLPLSEFVYVIRPFNGHTVTSILFNT